MKTIATVTLVALTAACGMSTEIPADQPGVAAKVTYEEAQGLAEQTLEAFNAGSYAGFTARWADDLKVKVPEAAFQQFREHTLGMAGEYQAVIEVRKLDGAKPGTMRYLIICEFEKATIGYALSFPTDGDAIVGSQMVILE